LQLPEKYMCIQNEWEKNRQKRLRMSIIKNLFSLFYFIPFHFSINAADTSRIISSPKKIKREWNKIKIMHIIKSDSFFFLLDIKIICFIYNSLLLYQHKGMIFMVLKNKSLHSITSEKRSISDNSIKISSIKGTSQFLLREFNYCDSFECACDAKV
jgi:hypothetical protein